MLSWCELQTLTQILTSALEVYPESISEPKCAQDERPTVDVGVNKATALPIKCDDDFPAYTVL